MPKRPLKDLTNSPIPPKKPRIEIKIVQNVPYKKTIISPDYVVEIKGYYPRNSTSKNLPSWFKNQYVLHLNIKYCNPAKSAYNLFVQVDTVLQLMDLFKDLKLKFMEALNTVGKENNDKRVEAKVSLKGPDDDQTLTLYGTSMEKAKYR